MLSIHYFFAEGEQGWSEQFFGPDTALQAGPYRTTAVAIGKLRKALLSLHAQLHVIRVHDLALRNQGAIDWTLSETQNAGGAGLPRDVTGSAARCTAFSAGHVYRRQVWLRGMPDDFITFAPGNSAPILSPAFVQRFNTWKQAIVDAGWTIRSISRPGTAGGPPLKAVMDVKKGPVEGSRIRVRVLNHGYPAGTAVRIRGAKFNGDDPGVNRVWLTITPVGAGADVVNEIEINHIPIPGKTWTYLGGGSIHARNLVHSPIAGISVEDFTTRDTGAIRYVPRGRGRRRRNSDRGPTNDALGGVPINVSIP